MTEEEVAAAGGITVYALKTEKEHLIVFFGPRFWEKQGRPDIFWTTVLHLLDRVAARAEAGKPLRRRETYLLRRLGRFLNGDGR
ncbi:MAG: hypothetical protein QW356_05495 [Candidatus Hadarchaeales archaeon]